MVYGDDVASAFNFQAIFHKKNLDNLIHMHIFEKKCYYSNRRNVFFHLPCSYGENVPASILMYGSILIDVTLRPHDFNKVPKDDAITPLPTPLMTPPVTKMYFIFSKVTNLHF